MQKLEIYTGEKTYIAPNGEIDTKENVLRKFPGVLDFKHVVLTDESGEISYGIMLLSALCSQHGVNQMLTDSQKIALLVEIMNAPPPEPEPSAEERIAAMLEFNAMMSL